VAGVAAMYLQERPTASPAEVRAAIIAGASSGVLANTGAGSPNMLLYSNPSGGTSAPCAGNVFTGSLNGPAVFEFQSNIDGFSGGNGQYAGSIDTPSGSVFTLTLEKKSKSRWSAVSTAQTTSGQVSYRGRNGLYRWRIESVIGSGSYSLCSTTP
jgi:hypothetical protein